MKKVLFPFVKTHLVVICKHQKKYLYSFELLKLVDKSTMRIFYINISDIDYIKQFKCVVWIFLWNISWKKINLQSCGWLTNNIYMMNNNVCSITLLGAACLKIYKGNLFVLSGYGRYLNEKWYSFYIFTISPQLFRYLKFYMKPDMIYTHIFFWYYIPSVIDPFTLKQG